MSSYSIISYSDSHLKLTEDGREYIYKKVYCSTDVSGDYLIFTTHELENGRLKQQYQILFSDCINPSVASALLLKTAVDIIINSYIVPLQTYHAVISQEATGAPTIDRLYRDDFTGLTWEYVTDGLYKLSGYTFPVDASILCNIGMKYEGGFHMEAYVDINDFCVYVVTSEMLNAPKNNLLSYSTLLIQA